MHLVVIFLCHRENLFFTGQNYAAAEVGITKSDKASAMSDGGEQMAYLHAITSGKWLMETSV